MNRPFLGTPAEIKALLDDNVIGQDSAKEALALGLFLFNGGLTARLKGLTTTIRPNVLLAGPSGSGKTLLVETLAKVTNNKLITINCSSLSAPGYKGVDLASSLGVELLQTNQELNSCILFLDEISAISTPDKYHLMTQKSLLEVLDGKEIGIEMEKDKKWTYGKFNSKNCFIVAAGAFPNLSSDTIERKRELQDIGMLTEIIDRFLFIRPTVALSEEQIEESIRENLFHHIEDYKAIYRVLGQNFTLSNLEIEALIARAKTGSMRSLRSALLDIVTPKLMSFKYDYSAFGLNFTPTPPSRGDKT